jgi:tryptophan synthase alpha chain
MGRIENTFKELKQAGRKGFVGYLTAGDPSVEESLSDIRCALANGVDILELGVPFSDPTADGPTIQDASSRALEGGMNLPRVLDMAREVRKESEAPIILFGYANPLLAYGYEKVCADAAEAGIDGMLIVDLPFEEWGELLPHIESNGLCFIPLIAPTTPKVRAAEILKDVKGFAYYVMVTGVTGARETLRTDLQANVAELRECTNLPVSVGFGISSGAQAKEAADSADAIVVGSALIKAARANQLKEFVQEIRSGLDS